MPVLGAITGLPASMFEPIKRALKAFFHDDVRLRVQGRSVRVSFEGPDGPYVPPAERARLAAERRERDELTRMRTELARLFDEDDGSRQRMPHLAFVEQQLAIQGLALLDKVSVALLREAHRQLDDAVLNWSQAGLATLRSKLAVAVRERGLGHGQDPEEAAAALQEARSAEAAEPPLEVVEQSIGSAEQALLEAYRAMREGQPEAAESASASTGRERSAA